MLCESFPSLLERIARTLRQKHCADEDIAMRKQFQTIAILSVATVAMIGGRKALLESAFAQAGAGVTQIPKFRAEGSWPKLPSKWIMAIVSSTWIDDQDHLWVLQRPKIGRAHV